MNFEVPLVTDMTPVDPPPGAAGAAGGAGGKRYNAITQGWQGNDDEHPDVSSGGNEISYVIQYRVFQQDFVTESCSVQYG